MICVSPPGIRISQVICVQGYTHYTNITHILLWQRQLTTYFATETKGDTHNTAAILEGGTHITSDICIPYAYHKWYVCRGTRTTHILHTYYCDNASSLRTSPQRPSEPDTHNTAAKLEGVRISLLICVSLTHITSDTSQLRTVKKVDPDETRIYVK